MHCERVFRTTSLNFKWIFKQVHSVCVHSVSLFLKTIPGKSTVKTQSFPTKPTFKKKAFWQKTLIRWQDSLRLRMCGFHMFYSSFFWSAKKLNMALPQSPEIQKMMRFPYYRHCHCVVYTVFQDRFYRFYSISRCLILDKLFTLSHQQRDLWMVKDYRRKIPILICNHFKHGRRK